MTLSRTFTSSIFISEERTFNSMSDPNPERNSLDDFLSLERPPAIRALHRDCASRSGRARRPGLKAVEMSSRARSSSKPAKTKSTPAKREPRSQSARPPGGGSAAGGGINFQAVVTAVAGVHLLRGTPIGWLDGEPADTPVAIWAETNGPGDDVRLELRTGGVAELQAKKGLARGDDLWTSLLDLAKAVVAGTIEYGVLAVAPNSSGTIRNDLAKDIRRLADGREDDLSEIGRDFLRRLRSAVLPVGDACRRLRIRVVHGLEADGIEIRAAKEVLRHVCAREADADAAWNVIYRDAVAIVERRGRWSLPSCLGC